MVKLGDIIDVLRKARRSTPGIQVCPKCGSPKLVPYSPLSDWLTPIERVCENCGYKGAILLEIEKQEEPQEEVE